MPTQHWLHFGIQAKKEQTRSFRGTKPGNTNVAEIHNQVLMMLAHKIFDPPPHHVIDTFAAACPAGLGGHFWG